MIMNILDFESEPQHLRYIKSRLFPRGIEPLLSEDWEIHGLHEDADFRIYVGPAKYKHLPESMVYVAIYPFNVYKIDSRKQWSYPKPEDSVGVLK